MEDNIKILLKPTNHVLTGHMDPVTFFNVLKALNERGFESEVSLFDKEDEDWTCWQPT